MAPTWEFRSLYLVLMLATLHKPMLLNDYIYNLGGRCLTDSVFKICFATLYIRALHMYLVPKINRGCQSPWNWSYGWLETSVWVLWMEPGFSKRASHALYHRATFPAPNVCCTTKLYLHHQSHFFLEEIGSRLFGPFDTNSFALSQALQGAETAGVHHRAQPGHPS